MLAEKPVRIARAPIGSPAIRVLICDDSAVIRMALERTLSVDPNITIVAKAANGQQAITAVQAGGVDVVLLDIEMPVMDGMTALPKILAADRGVKVLMSSTLTTQGAAIAMEALRIGAADFIAKPAALAGANQAFRADLLAKVLGLGRQARAGRPTPPPGADRSLAGPRPSQSYAPGTAHSPAQSAGHSVASAPPRTVAPTLRQPPVLAPAILAIGSSTGGPAALLALFAALGRLPTPIPILVTQHMPPTFTAQLASHIDRLPGCSCAEAVHNEKLRPGHIHLAPGDRHMLVHMHDGAPSIALSDDKPENFCRPAVDPMLRTLAPIFPGRTLVVMLTGMGHDGLAGSEHIVATGSGVIAQDEATSVVWGMPGAVARAGLCHAILPLPAIAPKILALLAGRRV